MSRTVWVPPLPMPDLKSRRRVFENTRFTVYADHISEGNLEVQDFLVVAPHCPRADRLAGVVIVPVCGDSILLLKRYRHPVSEHVWELPRGFIDPGEEPAAAALRELAEETGLACPPESLLSLGTFFPDPGIINARVALFAVTRCRPGSGLIDDEIGMGGGVWHPRDEVRRLLRSGFLQEGASCIALHRYYAALDDGLI
jgi:8-oxo-dGTP pyrophosphatase MutT (NUDIX family)